MKPSVLLVFAAVSCAVSACGHHPDPPPTIALDETLWAPAAPIAAPEPVVEIVTLPQPLPLPGQLKPVEMTGPGESDSADPQARVDAAHAAAVREPAMDGYVNAIQVYPYTPGALYQLYAAPERVSDIALQPGEEIVAVSAGDTVRWVIGDAVSGEGETARAHILVKPITDHIATNLVIITDRRAYHLELTSLPETYMASVSWRYPHDDLLALQRRNAQATRRAESEVETGLDLDRLQFRYAISGDTPPWRPLRAFDDGRTVFIQFPDRLDQGEAPPLFVVAEDGEPDLVNYRVRSNYYLVDRLFAAAELRLGEDRQHIVRIERTDVLDSAGRRP